VIVGVVFLVRCFEGREEGTKEGDQNKLLRFHQRSKSTLSRGRKARSSHVLAFLHAQKWKEGVVDLAPVFFVASVD
jgi:hypothetical protein